MMLAVDSEVRTETIPVYEEFERINKRIAFRKEQRSRVNAMSIEGFFELYVSYVVVQCTENEEREQHYRLYETLPDELEINVSSPKAPFSYREMFDGKIVTIENEYIGGDYYLGCDLAKDTTCDLLNRLESVRKQFIEDIDEEINELKTEAVDLTIRSYTK